MAKSIENVFRKLPCQHAYYCVWVKQEKKPEAKNLHVGKTLRIVTHTQGKLFLNGNDRRRGKEKLAA